VIQREFAIEIRGEGILGQAWRYRLSNKKFQGTLSIYRKLPEPRPAKWPRPLQSQTF